MLAGLPPYVQLAACACPTSVSLPVIFDHAWREPGIPRCVHARPRRSKLPRTHHSAHLAFPGVVAAHIEQPDKAVELDVEAGDLPVTLLLGRADEGDASAGLVGSAEGGVPAQSDGLAGDSVDSIDDDGERRVGALRLHEDLLGRKRGLAERLEDEGVDAVGSVDKAVGAVLLAVLVLIVGDQAHVEVDDLLALGLGEAVCAPGEERRERQGGHGHGRAREGGDSK